MDLHQDQELLYIAQEGLKAPLPDEWKPCQNRRGETFYLNLRTNQRTEEHPCDTYYREVNPS